MAGRRDGVDLAPLIAKGTFFKAMEETTFFVTNMRTADDRPSLEWPNRVDFSAAGLRFRAFSGEAEAAKVEPDLR
jgi:hypothetical protein